MNKTCDDIPIGPFSEEDLQQQWNQQADQFNQWHTLDLCEQLAWAQARAIDADRAASAALAAEPEGPSDEELDELAWNWYSKTGSTWWQVEAFRAFARAALARWGRPATPPAPEPVAALAVKLILESKPMDPELAAVLTPGALWDLYSAPTTAPAPELGELGEAGELVAWLNQEIASLEAHCNKVANGECRTLACLQRGGYVRSDGPPDPSVATCPELENANTKRRAATLLQQPSAPAPVAVSERPWDRPGWCDTEGRCWLILHPDDGFQVPIWRLDYPSHYDLPDRAFSLPAHAIPLPAPQAGEGEA